MEQASPTLVPTLMSVLRQGSLWLINQSSIPTLIKQVLKGKESSGRSSAAVKVQTASTNARLLLTTISKHCPELYRAHVSQLLKAIADDKSERLIEIALQALAAVSKHDSGVIPSDKYVTRMQVRLR